MQKEVKIIGLTINNQLGILKSCELEFNKENKLIPVLGSVGAGKTTLQKSLQLGTHGSDTLKADKQLYGNIDQEVKLLDGDTKIFIGCKSKGDSLDYVIYTRDENGKVVKNPIIDGVKITPAKYLKDLQTALTWRMDELTSENPTTQKKILLELYKSELSTLGVVFDKSSEEYSKSILGRIDLAVNDRAQKDFSRKQVGGLAVQLEPLGINVSDEDTWPKRGDFSDLETKRSKLQYDIDNVGHAKKQRLDELKNKADAVVNKLKEENINIEKSNSILEEDFNLKKTAYSQNIHTFNGVLTDLKTLFENGCLTEFEHVSLTQDLKRKFKNQAPICGKLSPIVLFEGGKCISNAADFTGNSHDLLVELQDVKNTYKVVLSEQDGDTSRLESELADVVSLIQSTKENNHHCDMIDSFIAWKKADAKVIELRHEYANLLGSINTGVEGLNIKVDNDDSKQDIYLVYDGSYDAEYFSNPNKEFRKLSSYSGTQKPMICLLLQEYLLRKKTKAMRYLWIDNVPIDKKTRILLEKMGEDLGVTIIVNITGDFDQNNLNDGEILIDGGEVFFK